MAGIISPQVLSDLIGSIYDCALDPSRWNQTLNDIKTAFNSHNVALSLSDVRHDRVLLLKNVGLEPRDHDLYSVHAAEIHDLLLTCLARPLDEAHVASRVLPPGYMEASPYFQAAQKRGVADMMQFILMHEATHFSGFAVGQREIIAERDIKLGKLLLPHLRRSVTISKVLEVRTIERARMAQTLDALRCAVLLTDERGTILHANRMAEHMLHDGGPILDAKGILQASVPSAASELRAALGLAARNEAGIGNSGLAIRLTTPDSGLPPVFAHVLPLTSGDFRTRLQPAAVAAVFIGAPVHAQDGADIVAAAFDLTPAETRVLASLLAGRTLVETATALGITRYTANTHLDHIFQKTGVTRQADLMRLGMGLISPAGSKG